MLRPMLYRQDVVADFLHTVLGSDDFTTSSGSNQNESPTLYHLACLLLVQSGLRQAGVTQDIRHALCTSLAERLARDATSTDARPKMPRALLKQTQNNYRDDAAALDAAFFTDAPFSTALEQASQNTTDAPQSIAAQDHFSAPQQQVLKDLTDGIIQQLHADPTSWKQYYQRRKSRKDGSEKPGSAPGSASVIRIESLLQEVCAVLR